MSVAIITNALAIYDWTNPAAKNLNENLIEAAIRGGAYCSYLSGSGSSIIALSDKREYTIGYEMAETARTFGINGKTMVVPISDSGARVKVWLEKN